MQTSVIEVRSEHHRAVHPTQKPLGIVAPLIEYSVPPGGLVMDLFSGSGTVALAARNAGRRCIAFEAREDYCEAAAKRLAHQTFDFGDWDETA
jgi:site-specific DNA-methyltransferase (adenine-specific)